MGPIQVPIVSCWIQMGANDAADDLAISFKRSSIDCTSSRAQPAEASQGWKHVDTYSLTSRAAWISQGIALVD
jgi:hypothetical protein